MRKLLRLTIKLILGALRLVARLFTAALPSLLVFLVLTSPTILMNRGVPLIQTAEPSQVHELIPHTRWGDLKPCGEFFNEEKEFEKALQCVNTKVWSKDPLKAADPLVPIVPPRCFVVSANSPDVFSSQDLVFNAIPIADIFGNIGGVVGVYQPETRTVYIVENLDAPSVYRHELQHFFLHLHEPITQGGGHFQEVWQKCEPPYYDPSTRAKILGTLRESKIKKRAPSAQAPKDSIDSEDIIK